MLEQQCEFFSCLEEEHTQLLKNLQGVESECPIDEYLNRNLQEQVLLKNSYYSHNTATVLHVFFQDLIVEN